MIAAIHQPHFLPWIGYFNKIAHSDVFVWMNRVQYRRRYFQNRCRIRLGDSARWITVPVRGAFDSAISDIEVSDHGNWRRKVIGTLEHAYSSAPFFSEIWPRLCSVLERPHAKLEHLNLELLQELLEVLGISRVRVVLQSDLEVKTGDRNRRLLEICEAVGAHQYICGQGGRNYVDTDAFEKSSIEILWQAFDPDRHPYRQVGPGFVPGLSALDALFTLGPLDARKLIDSVWTPKVGDEGA